MVKSAVLRWIVRDSDATLDILRGGRDFTVTHTVLVRLFNLSQDLEQRLSEAV